MREGGPPASPVRYMMPLNACAVTSMEIIGGTSPNSFPDLAALCGKLIQAAGRRSHFEGLLMLNISSLLNRAADEDRLRALGEVLAMENGLASRCLTVLYGPVNEKELLMAADCLDCRGRLRVAEFQMDPSRETLRQLLAQASLACAPGAEQALEAALADMREAPRFSPLRFLQSCAAGDGTITEVSLRAVLNDPYSYYGRQKKTQELRAQDGGFSERRIGF